LASGCRRPKRRAVRPASCRSCLPGLDGQLGAEAMAQFRRGISAEYAEGVLAFREKRAVEFSRTG
jgi:hypothetical protein